MLPKYKDFTSDTSREYLSLVSGFVQQSIAKYFLTEGNKLMLSAFASVKDQGSYAIVDNYGSLVVRMVFLPLEDALRSQFSSMTGDDSSRLERKSLLMKWLKRSLYFGILFLIFGPSYSSLFVKWFLGMKWQGAGAATVLSAYSAMIPFLGMNGILEAFVYSFASQKDVVGMIPFMVLNFMVYIGSSLFFVNVLHYGPIGLIYGNILNMSMRIAYCLIFIRRSYEEYMLPSFSTLCVASVVLSRILVQLIMIFIEHDILRVVSGGLVCLLLCLVFVLEERGLKAKQE
jgi:oligosaccharide translocation protein RFT1